MQILRGDLNRDGKVNAVELTLLKQVLLGISLCCVFFSANAVFELYGIKNDLNHLH